MTRESGREAIIRQGEGCKEGEVTEEQYQQNHMEPPENVELGVEVGQGKQEKGFKNVMC